MSVNLFIDMYILENYRTKKQIVSPERGTIWEQEVWFVNFRCDDLYFMSYGFYQVNIFILRSAADHRYFT